MVVALKRSARNSLASMGEPAPDVHQGSFYNTLQWNQCGAGRVTGVRKAWGPGAPGSREIGAAVPVAERTWVLASYRLRIVGMAGALLLLTLSRRVSHRRIWWRWLRGCPGLEWGKSDSDRIMEEEVATGAGSSGELAQSAAKSS